MQISFSGEYPELHQWKVDLYKTAPLHYPPRNPDTNFTTATSIFKAGSPDPHRYSICNLHYRLFTLLPADRGRERGERDSGAGLSIAKPGPVGISHVRKTNESLSLFLSRARRALETYFTDRIHQMLRCFGRTLI